MRAVNGIRIQKNENGVIRNYASVMRCEDIRGESKFKIDDKEQVWSLFMDSIKNEWSFKVATEAEKKTQQIVFAHMWKKVGKRICDWRKKIDGGEMENLDYTQASI